MKGEGPFFSCFIFQSVMPMANLRKCMYSGIDSSDVFVTGEGVCVTLVRDSIVNQQVKQYRHTACTGCVQSFVSHNNQWLVYIP